MLYEKSQGCWYWSQHWPQVTHVSIRKKNDIFAWGMGGWSVRAKKLVFPYSGWEWCRIYHPVQYLLAPSSLLASPSKFQGNILRPKHASVYLIVQETGKCSKQKLSPSAVKEGKGRIKPSCSSVLKPWNHQRMSLVIGCWWDSGSPWDSACFNSIAVMKTKVKKHGWFS